MGGGSQSLSPPSRPVPLLKRSLALAGGDRRQTWPLSCKSRLPQISVLSVTPQGRLAGFRMALGCSPTSLSSEWFYLPDIQRQAVIHSLFPSPLTLPQAHLTYEKKFTVQTLPFSPTAKIPPSCLPEKATNRGTIIILTGSVKISAQGTAICKELGMI